MNVNNEQAKQEAMAVINSINAVEGFDPTPLAMEIANMNDGSKRYRLPVMAQIAWFRLKYPEGRISVKVIPGKDYFTAEARVFADYRDPMDCYLAEGSAARGLMPDKPSVSPREWAQTAAIGIALRNAGFGLQFAVAGESGEDNAVNEFAFTNETHIPNRKPTETAAANTPEKMNGGNASPQNSSAVNTVGTAQAPPSEQMPAHKELTPFEKAMAAICPITKYKDKTLGDLIRIDPNALAYIAKSAGKYGNEIADCAKLICETAMQQASA